MNGDEHYLRLGKLVASYQSLEFFLRLVLQSLPSARPLGIPHGVNICSFPVGKKLPESELTSYDTLGKLIDTYNKEIHACGGSQLDKALVEVRDTLAHGRVSAAREDGTLRLLKFGKPKEGRVMVVFNEEMSADWFARQTKRVFEAIKSVCDFAERSKMSVDVIPPHKGP